MIGMLMVLAGPGADVRVADDTPASSFNALVENALFLVAMGGIALIGVAIALCLARALRGPTLADRGVASDTIAVMLAGLAILLTIVLETLVLFDSVLIVAILGFGSTVAFAQYIGRRREA